MVPFEKRVLVLGFGSVSQCTLPILFKHIHVQTANVTVIDFDDRAAALRSWTDQGVRFVRERIAPENLGRVLAQHVSAGDILVDLAWNIDCCEILQWCHDHGESATSYDDIDDLMVAYFHHLYEIRCGPSRASNTLNGLVCLQPRFKDKLNKRQASPTRP